MSKRITAKELAVMLNVEIEVANALLDGAKSRAGSRPRGRRLGLLFALCASGVVLASVRTQLGVFFARLGPPRAGEAVPRQLPYRGYLERNGTPVNEPSGMEFGFSLYPSDGGVPFTSASIVPVSNGNFSVDIGDVVAIPASILDDPGASLEIQLNPSSGGPVLAGRQRLLSVAFSQRSAIAWNAVDSSHAANADAALLAANSTNAALAARATIADDSTQVTSPAINGHRTTLIGLYCGVAPAQPGEIRFPPVTGSLTGLAAAKSVCETVVGCGALAHMCTTHEMVVSAQLGLGPTQSAWIASGVYSSWSNRDVNDCLSFTNKSSFPIGPAWEPSVGSTPQIGLGQWRSCDTVIGIACCR